MDGHSTNVNVILYHVEIIVLIISLLKKKYNLR